MLRRRHFKRNEKIFHQGDPGDSLFIIESGSVKVVLLSSEGAEDAIIAILGPGMFFGELALLDGAPRSASAIAVEPSETLSLDRGLLTTSSTPSRNSVARSWPPWRWSFGA
jgi:CRP-like cAMP-binding protein